MFTICGINYIVCVGVAEAAAAAAAAGVPPAVQAKPQTPNVVITSSDTLPAYTNSAVPAMSVTIPPHHIKGVTPTKLNPNQNQVHAFQIPMPPQAQMVCIFSKIYLTSPRKIFFFSKVALNFIQKFFLFLIFR